MQCLPTLLMCLAMLVVCYAAEEYQPSYMSHGNKRSSDPGNEGKFSWLRYVLSKPRFDSEVQYIPSLEQKSNPSHFILSENSPSENSASDSPYISQDSIPAHKRQSSDLLGKRFTDFALPYFKYKRNNGIWIWMPAQGYVSVPKDQQALASAEAAKQGKIMRYGK